MDISSLIGFLLAIILIVGSILIGSSPISAFIDIPSILIVFGGSIGAAMICFPIKSIIGMPRVMMKVFRSTPVDVKGMIVQIVSLAETARRDGLLALEGRLEEVTNPFIKLGIQLAVDGTRPEVIEDILRTEIDAISGRHREGKAVMDQLGRFAPAYGMIGTLLGLIMMLSNMADPSGIGSGMAVALITTLYGAVASNVVFMPFAEKLASNNKYELNALEIVVRGVMAIQSGENPRVIEQKLYTFLPAKQRPQEEAA
jgi:chemotaxis protein MotA